MEVSSVTSRLVLGFQSPVNRTGAPRGNMSLHNCCCWWRCQSDERWNHFKGNVGETSERRGGAHMGFSERIDTILN